MGTRSATARSVFASLLLLCACDSSELFSSLSVPNAIQAPAHLTEGEAQLPAATVEANTSSMEHGDTASPRTGPTLEPAADATLPQPPATLEAATAAIDVWTEPLRRCRHRPRYHCDGPRRVPVAGPAARSRAERLDLGSRAAYGRILRGPADPALLTEAALAGEAEPNLLWPVPRGTFGRGFGYTRRGGLRETLHRGVDMPAEVGAEVRAVNPGLVVYADNGIRGYGNLVVILHSDDTRTYYAHLERAVVAAGDLVQRGQPIAAIGRTGLTRAPPLHFEYRRRAVPRDPRRRFVERPRGEEERALLNEQRDRRRAGEARLAELRARAERRRARAAAHGAVEEAVQSSAEALP
ncbi:MAG: M23 family metallopeptidase [Myxococcota bacterium]